MIVFEGFAEGEAGDGVDFALAPGGAPVRVIHGDGLGFGVVEGQVDKDFGDARLEIVDEVDVVVGPAGRRDGFAGGKDGVGNGIGRRQQRQHALKGFVVACAANGQLIFVRDSQEDTEQFG